MSFAIGGEYAQFFNASTLAFNVNYGTDDDNDVDAYGINGAYRIFASHNLRFDLGAGLGRAEAGGIDATSTRSALASNIASTTRRSPLARPTAASMATFAEADVVGVTLRWNFGDETLKQADRKGKTFTGLGSALSGF